MCLYFDAVFYPVWFICTIIHLVGRQPYLSDIWFVSLVAASALFIFINPARIYLGYMGNITESTPHVLCFLLLSVFPSLILNAYLFFPSFISAGSMCPVGDSPDLEVAPAIESWQCNPPSNTMVHGIQVNLVHFELQNKLTNVVYFSDRRVYAQLPCRFTNFKTPKRYSRYSQLY